jgi:hypothetical protein
MDAIVRKFKPPPYAANEKIAEDFAKDLYSERLDPSDPDECFKFLADLYPNRLKEVLANADRAAYECGQLYIEAEMARQDHASQDF